MDFARKQLEKYGWQEGKGLGKHENGISLAIKPKLKFDTSGFGHNHSEEYCNNWWQNLYNRAANDVDVINKNGEVHMKVVPKTAKVFSKMHDSLAYGSFVKTSKLTDKGIIDFHNNNDDIFDKDSDVHKINIISDEELFAACGGRTAHKGARHGIKSSGKLSRIEKQEKMLLKKLRRVSLSDDSNTNKKHVEKKLRKLGSHKKDAAKLQHINKVSITNEQDLNPSLGPCSLLKKRKKERRRVSFHDTVTEYHSQEQDLDSTSHSENSSNSPVASKTTVLVRKSKIKEVGNEARCALEVDDRGSEQDEGFSSDVDGINAVSSLESECDVARQRKFKSLSKKERKILKRNLQNMQKSDTQTNRFLQACGSPQSLHAAASVVVEKLASVKRKLKLESEEYCVVKTKKRNCEMSSKKHKKTSKEKDRKLHKQINNVTNSFNVICKISELD